MKKILLVAMIICLLWVPEAIDASELPQLNWEVRSDWIDVTKDVAPAAVGDGKSDDTAALQAALDTLLSHGRCKAPVTVYLPAGTYRITRALSLAKKRGIMIVGHGRTTRIIWDGSSGGTMYWSNGVGYCRYVGMVWDGKGKAGVGHLHASNTLFETRVSYEHMAFCNLDYGILTGKDRTYATAESWYQNCLFENCTVGLGLQNFNDYNHTLYGCLFRNCGYGVHTYHGTAYIFNSRFEGSKVVDFLADGEHGQSMRRCTSEGSRSFIEHRGVGPLVVQDCHVGGWTNTDHWAMKLEGRAPALVFDCVFTDPPAQQPPIHIGESCRVIFSRNRIGPQKYQDLYQHPGVTVIPPGKEEPVVNLAQQSFFQEGVCNQGKVFDAKEEFGAKGDDKTDDTAALQKTIDAAQEHSKGALAYLPPGMYKVTDTLRITGGNYLVGGGVAQHTQIIWHGMDNGVVLSVEDPLDVTLQHLSVTVPDGVAATTCAIQHKAFNGNSRMQYDGVYVPGKYWQKDTRPRGLECMDLAKGAVVHIKHMDGEMRFINCGRAKILVNRSHDGQILVEGTQKHRDGFLGFMFRLSTISSSYAVSLLNNHSLVMSDLYHEQGKQHLLAQGSNGEPQGRVTIQGAKLHSRVNPVIQVNNYKGWICYGPQQWYSFKPVTPIISQIGERPVDMILMGNMTWDGPEPVTRCTEVAKLAKIQNAWGQNTIPEGMLQKAAGALDDLRKLGELDLELNFHHVTGCLCNSR